MASIKVFCCYAHRDTSLLENLKAHLTLLQRQGLISLWVDTDISPGSNWEQEIEKHLNTAHIILLLISSDFLYSDYCYSKEMFRALDRHQREEAIVIPIILRPVYWQGAPFAKLQVLPTGAKPILSSSWHSMDEALLDVVNGIGAAIKHFQYISSARDIQLRVYISQEVQKGRPVSEVLTECDPNLETLFQTIIDAVTKRISTVLHTGKQTNKVFKDCSPALENLFQVGTSTYLDEIGVTAVARQIEKLVREISPIADGDLTVQAEVTADILGVLADSINYIIEELAVLIFRVQTTSTAIVEIRTALLDAIQAHEKASETITNIAKDEISFPSENEKMVAFTNEMKRLENINGTMALQTEHLKMIMDALYDSVSAFRLPQNVSALSERKGESYNQQ